MYTVYGIPNCNTVKKAVEWLNAHQVAFVFHDYKKKGIAAGQLKKWIRHVSWEMLVNKKGTTWRMLDEAAKAAVIDDESAIALMQEHTSVIKRPVIELGNKVIAVGFDEEVYEKAFG